MITVIRIKLAESLLVIGTRILEIGKRVSPELFENYMRFLVNRWIDTHSVNIDGERG